MLKTVLVLALGLVTQGWYTYAPGGKDYRVDLPARPETTSRVVNTAAGQSQLSAARLKTAIATYSVEVTENQGNVDPNTFDEGLRRFAAARKATLGAVSTITVDGKPGRDF